MTMTTHTPDLSQRNADGVLCDATHVSVSAQLGRLQFHKSGKFRLLQLADIQDGPRVSKDTIALISAACDAARPDLVVFSGNQVAGYDPAYASTFLKRPWSANWADSSLSDRDRQKNLDQTARLVRAGIEQFLKPLIDRCIPFAVTYGNHDTQCGLDIATLDAIYREFPGCLNPKAVACDPKNPQLLMSSDLTDQKIYACEPGTFALPVANNDGSENVLGIVLLNSGTYALSGGCGSPSLDALEFLRSLPAFIQAQSMVFQNIPVPQYYRLLRPVPSTRAHAVQGYRTFDGSYYEIDPDATVSGSYLGEGISCPDKDSGEFDILSSSGNYFALAAGHDHRNGFAGQVDNLLLVATPTCGFGSYGPAPAKRAARLFEFDIRHPFQPRTQLLEFGEIVGKPSSKKAYSFGSNYVPRSGEESYDLIKKKSLWSRLIQRLRTWFR